MAMPWRSPPESLRDGGIDRDAGATEAYGVLQDLIRDLLFAANVDEAEAVGNLPPDEKVPPKGLLLGKRLVLVDGFDREVMRHAYRVIGEVELLVTDEYPPRGGREHSGQYLDERGLSGAVVADQSDDLIPADRKIDVAERLDCAEEFLHPLKAHDVPVVRFWRALGQVQFCHPLLPPASSCA